MAGPSLSQLFRRYTDDGDVRALGEVFDRAAPELLTVARHLAGDEAAAEDLVQATFLAAIEHPERFDPSRDLVPWLLGVLANKARAARTREARVPDPARLSGERIEDPETDAQLREFMGTLEKALERVPEAYRNVLRIHLAEGKGPEEIARELERNSDTVRVQLHRGLRHLRRRLPAGFALGGLVLVSAPRGMQVLRASVLERAASLAGAAATGGAAAGIAGGVLVGKKILVTAFMIALASGSWWLLRERAQPTIDTSVAEASTPTLEGPAELPPASSPELGTSESASTSQPRETVAASTDYGSIDMEWTWSDGTPAVGITIGGLPYGEEFPGDHPFIGRTDESGHVVLDHIRAGPIEFQTDRGGSSEWYKSSVERDRRTHARFVVRPGIEVRGRVFDPQDRAVASALVSLAAFEDQAGLLVATSGIDGSYSIRDVDPSCFVFATASGFGGSELKRPPKPAPGAQLAPPLNLKLRGGGGSVGGLVRDPDARAVAGAWVVLRCPSTVEFGREVKWPRLWKATDADGSYRFDGVRAGAVDVLIDADGFASWTRSIQVETGQSVRVDAQLENGFVVEGTVRMADGAAAANAEVARGLPTTEWRRNSFAKTNAEGSYRLHRIPSGPTEVRILHEEGERISRASTNLEGRSGDVLRWDATLKEPPKIVGRVVDEAGRPLPGWRMEVWTREVVGHWPRRATTDAEGRFVLRDCPDVLFTVACYSPEYEGNELAAAGAYQEEVRPGGGELLLEVPKSKRPGSFIEGKFVDEQGHPVAGLQIVVRSPPQPSVNSADVSPETGSFRMGPVPEGDYELGLCRNDRPYMNLPKVELQANEEKDLGTITLKSSGRLELVLLREDGALIDPISVRAYYQGWGHLLETDDCSTFRSKELHEGTYTLFPVGRNVSTVPQEIEIRAGETTRLEVRLPPGVYQVVTFRGQVAREGPDRLNIAVRTAVGSLMFEQERGHGWDKNMLYTSTFHAGFPPGRYEVEAKSADGWEGRATFEISATATKTEVVEAPLVRKP